MTHIAKIGVKFCATSFSHSIYLVINEYSKKVEKSCHLGVEKSKQSLCSSFTLEIRPLGKNLQFRPFLVLLHTSMTSQSIRHPKLHGIGYKKCQNRTIFEDFRPFYLQIEFYENRGNRDIWFFYFYIKFEPFFVLLHTSMTSQSIIHPKLQAVGYQRCQNWTISEDSRPL